MTFFVEKGGPNWVRWKQTASFIVELGPGLAPLRVYRLRCHGANYPLVRYFAEHELKRLFRRARKEKR